MRACALIGAVDFNERHFKAQDFDYLIAVDGGLRHLERIKVEPDVIIGDFDSLGYYPEGDKVIAFPTRKDESDIELALNKAYQEGYDLFYVYGCLAGRLDFSYAVLQLLLHYAKKGCRIFGVGDSFTVSMLVGGEYDLLEFEALEEGIVSAFAATDVVQGVDEIGLEYALDKATLYNDKPLGVSNAFTGKKAQICVEEGALLVFFPDEAISRLHKRSCYNT